MGLPTNRCVDNRNIHTVVYEEYQRWILLLGTQKQMGMKMSINLKRLSWQQVETTLSQVIETSRQNGTTYEQVPR